MRYALLLAPALLLAITTPATAEEKEVPNTNRALYSEVGRKWKYSSENWELDEKERKKREKAAAKKKKKDDRNDEEAEELKHDFTGREKKVHNYWEYEVTKVEARQGEYTFRAYTPDGELDSIQTNRMVVLDVAPWFSGTATEIRKETLAVDGLRFECSVCEVDREGSDTDSLEWRSIKYPGLVVRSELSVTGGSYDSVYVQVLVEVAGFGAADDKGDAAADDSWKLYRKQGRKWRMKRDPMIGGKAAPVTYTTYEVAEAGKDSCKLKTQALKADEKPLLDATITEIKFDKDSEHLVKPAATAVEVRKEKLKAAGREWQCIVYEDKKAVKGTTITTWMAVDFPGLCIKKVEKSDTSEVTAALDQFTE